MQLKELGFVISRRPPEPGTARSGVTRGARSEVRNLVLVSLAVILGLGAHLYFYAYPTLAQTLVHEAERDARRVVETIRTAALAQHRFDRPPTAATVASIERLRHSLGVLKIKLFGPDGGVHYSTDLGEVGTINRNAYFREIVARGELYSNVVRKDDRTLDGETYVRDVVETYVPIIAEGRFLGAFEVYLDITESRQTLDARVRHINVSLGILLAVLLGVFGVIVANSYQSALRLEREQTTKLRQEISRRHEVEAELRESHGRYYHLAHHDHMTGIPNRALFMDRLNHAIASARRYETRLALLYIDLDHFKPINDLHGHEVGDRVLKATAETLRRNVRESDTVARLAGDEFAVLLERADPAEVEALASRLCREFRQSLDVDGLGLDTSASIGIGLYPQDGGDVETLLHHADMAMYRAKAEAPGSWRYFRYGDA